MSEEPVPAWGHAKAAAPAHVPREPETRDLAHASPPQQPEQADPGNPDRIRNLHRRGWTQQRIAGLLGLAQSTVSRVLAPAARPSSRRLRALLAQQHDRLDFIIDECMQAWHRSQTEANPAGDAAFLGQATGAVALQLRLWQEFDSDRIVAVILKKLIPPGVAPGKKEGDEPCP